MSAISRKGQWVKLFFYISGEYTPALRNHVGKVNIINDDVILVSESTWHHGMIMFSTSLAPLMCIHWSPVDSYPKIYQCHDDIIKWKQFPRHWRFVRGNHRWSVTPQNGQWRGALMFSLICVWTNGWVNNRDASDLRRHCAHCDVTVIQSFDVSLLSRTSRVTGYLRPQ